MDSQVVPSLQESGKNFYAILGVAQYASLEAIEEAYGKYSLLCHPSVPNYNPHILPLQTLSHEEYWTSLNRAYEVLSNEQYRLVYDAAGEEGLKNDTIVQSYGPAASYEPSNPWAVFGNFVFEQLLKGRNRWSESFCFRLSSYSVFTPLPAIYRIDLTLEELFSGTVKALRYERLKTVNGVTVMFEEMQRIKFQPGMRHGDSICLPGMGNMVEGFTGDAMITISQLPHKYFAVQDVNLSTTLMVPLKIALTGGVMPLHCIDGKTIQLPIIEPCHPGKDICLQGEGMPDPITKKRGNLFVRLMVQFPAKIPPRAKRELSRILDQI